MLNYHNILKIIEGFRVEGGIAPGSSRLALPSVGAEYHLAFDTALSLRSD